MRFQITGCRVAENVRACIPSAFTATVDEKVLENMLSVIPEDCLSVQRVSLNAAGGISDIAKAVFCLREASQEKKDFSESEIRSLLCCDPLKTWKMKRKGMTEEEIAAVILKDALHEVGSVFSRPFGSMMRGVGTAVRHEDLHDRMKKEWEEGENGKTDENSFFEFLEFNRCFQLCMTPFCTTCGAMDYRWFCREVVGYGKISDMICAVTEESLSRYAKIHVDARDWIYPLKIIVREWPLVPGDCFLMRKLTFLNKWI